ncbi:amidohydrolase family protein [Robertkochia marina]|uniref:Amidohydrolase family protein n=1 Tax=Robertkochia marina TaxID=1227945 RepID=A0A4S3LZ68_9FLAO|nr:amidohydrolase family protein [Robertkochia marina]THD67410.1 amidohydrolase family protein [Robertkochia marina]TRZ40809.1 amidohydrolase family protein [Robertkochia marina]
MIRITSTFIFLLLFLSPTIKAQEAETFIIAGLFYDSQENKLLKDRMIHIEGNKITKVGHRINIPKGSKVIDLSDYTVLPGLIDSHTHVLFDQEPLEDFAEHSISTLVLESPALRTLRGVERAKSYLDVGITTIKDLGNSGEFLDVALRDAINEGSIEGPRIFAAGQIMSGQGGQIYGVRKKYQEIVEEEYRIIKGPADAINAVSEHINQGVDLIKICADNLPNNTKLTIPEMESIVKTAHRSGLTVTAHSVTNQSAWDAIKAGVDGIEHGFFIADSTLSLMADKNVFLVPTENSLHYMRTYYELQGKDPDKLSWLDRYMKDMRERLMKAIDKKVMIVAGSDNYTDIQVPRGVSSRDMFKAYYESGMKPLNILQSATYLAAKSFNKENEIGSLSPESYADIIAINGDLQNDFLNSIEDVVFVMKDGKIYFDNSIE